MQKDSVQISPAQLQEKCCRAIDQHVADGGTISFRRFGTFILDEDGKIKLKDQCGCALSILAVGKEPDDIHSLVGVALFVLADVLKVPVAALICFIRGFDGYCDDSYNELPNETTALSFYKAGKAVRVYVGSKYFLHTTRKENFNDPSTPSP